MTERRLLRKGISRWLPVLLLAAALAACSTAATADKPAVTPTLGPTLTPSPTPLPLALLVSPAQPRNTAEQLARQSVEEFATAQGWVLKRLEPGADGLTLALLENPRLVAFVGSGMGEQITAAAAARSDLLFAAVEESGVTPATNLLVVGGEHLRGDQAAFLAGLLAGLDTQNDYVGWIGEAGTVRGKLYQNGFRHGVRYTCPLCRIFDYELPSVADAAAGQMAADSLAGDYADTASAIPGPAGNAALLDLASGRIRIAGAQPDFQTGLFGDDGASGALQVLGSPAVRPDILLADLLPRFLGGEKFDAAVPYSIENGSLEFAPFSNDWITPGQQRFLGEILAQIASGRLDIGVDPQTGEER